MLSTGIQDIYSPQKEIPVKSLDGGKIVMKSR